MHYEKPKWKDGWERVQHHYDNWWKRRGPVLVISNPPPLLEARANVSRPLAPRDPRKLHTDPAWFAANQRYSLSRARFPADNLPIAFTDYGCAQLAACLESEPEFDDHTVWYKKCIDSPADCPPLTPTQTAQWWTAYRHVMERAYATSEGD